MDPIGGVPSVTTSTLDVIREIVALDEDERGEAIEAFMEARQPQFTRFARNFCRNNSVPTDRYLADVTQLVAMEAWVMLTEALADVTVLDTLQTWEGMLHRRSRVKVRSYLDGADAPMSGMKNARRRHRELMKTRSELRKQWGREPREPEIVEETNRRLRATRKDPRTKASSSAGRTSRR